MMMHKLNINYTTKKNKNQRKREASQKHGINTLVSDNAYNRNLLHNVFDTL